MTWGWLHLQPPKLKALVLVAASPNHQRFLPCFTSIVKTHGDVARLHCLCKIIRETLGLTAGWRVLYRHFVMLHFISLQLKTLDLGETSPSPGFSEIAAIASFGTTNKQGQPAAAFNNKNPFHISSYGPWTGVNQGSSRPPGATWHSNNALRRPIIHPVQGTE